MNRRIVVLLCLLLLVPASVTTGSTPRRTPSLILFDRQVDLRFAAAIEDKTERVRAVWTALRAEAQRAQAPVLELLRRKGIPARSFLTSNAIAAELDPATIALLRERPEVAAVLDDSPRQALPDPQPEPAAPVAPETAEGIEWGIRDIRADEVWSTYNITGSGIVIGGNDTGIQWNHPALINQYRGWDGATASHDYNWYDAIHSGGGSCGPNTTAPCDDYGHGTHTIGTAVGSDGGEAQIGVAPGARWIGCRNMDEGNGTIATYAECFDWFLAPTDLSGDNPRFDLAPDIINNSWGCVPSEGCDQNHLAALEQGVEALTAAGIMVVASAGNEGSSCGTIRNPPAIYPSSLSVGAYNSSGTIASFSSRGPITYNGSSRVGPDLTAPGVSVYSSWRGNTYINSSGTSMAAPHVAGTVALLWSARPELRGKIELTIEILKRTARPTSAPGTACDQSPDARPNNVFGWGRLDAKDAVTEALNPILEVSLTNTADGQPIAGAIITISGPLTSTGTTNHEGRASFVLPAGEYSITAADNVPGIVQTTVVLTTDMQLNLELARYRQYVPALATQR